MRRLSVLAEGCKRCLTKCSGPSRSHQGAGVQHPSSFGRYALSGRANQALLQNLVHPNIYLQWMARKQWNFLTKWLVLNEIKIQVCGSCKREEDGSFSVPNTGRNSRTHMVQLYI